MMDREHKGHRRIDFLGLPIDALTMDETVRLISDAMRSRRRIQHCAINAAKIVKMRDDSDLRGDVASSDLLNADGMAIVWAARMLGRHLPERVAGIDLMEGLLSACEENGFRPYILGARQDVLDRALAVIEARHPKLQLAGSRNGYFTQDEEPAIVAAINASAADCLFVAMPTPRKERFNARNRAALTPSFIMGVGGSVDVIAGHVSRAPLWMQDAGLEWLHRLLQEPRRMFRRYAVTNTLFVLLVAKAVLWQRLGRQPRSLLAAGSD